MKTISIHLGETAQERREALESLAADAGYYWNGRPSVGRWICALADIRRKELEMEAPDWAKEKEVNRSPAKAARLAALYLIRDELPDIPKTELARRFGVSRWTLDRDLAAMPQVKEAMERKERG